jgi:hypothetical protein
MCVSMMISIVHIPFSINDLVKTCQKFICVFGWHVLSGIRPGRKAKAFHFQEGLLPHRGVFILLLKGSSILSLEDELPWDFLDNLICQCFFIGLYVQ